MENVKREAQRLFFRTGERIAIIAVLVFALLLFVTQTAMKAYSDSEEKPYRQESAFSAISNSNQYMNGAPETNPSPVGLSDADTPKIIEISYEVDKITPTPTPTFDPSTDSVWLKVADCESHQNWGDDTGNGYYGGLQFSLGAWASVGGSGKPSDASSSEQIMRGRLLQSERGWGAWGACAKKLDLD